MLLIKQVQSMVYGQFVISLFAAPVRCSLHVALLGSLSVGM